MATATEFNANPFVIGFYTAGVAWAANQTWIAPAPCRVIDYWAVQTGTPAGSVDIRNGGTNSISGGVHDVSGGGDTDIIRGVELDDAYRDLVGGDVLTVVPASSPICDVFVLLVWTT